MDALLVSTVFGLGLLFVFDALVRPGVRAHPAAWLRRLGTAVARGCDRSGDGLRRNRLADRRPRMRRRGRRGPRDASAVSGRAGVPGAARGDRRGLVAA